MTATQTVATKRPQSPIVALSQLFETKRDELVKVLPKGIDMGNIVPRLIARAARNPALLKCTPISIYTAVHQALQLGLEPESPLGHFYLIPRRNKHADGATEAVPLIGYKGFCELARRSGEIAKLDAHVIYSGEEFTYDRGQGRVSHPYKFEVDRSDQNIIGAYAYAKLKGVDDPIVAVLSRSEIEARRSRSLAADSGPWKTDYAAMARKTAIRALMTGGLIPLSIHLQGAIELEDDTDAKLEIQNIKRAVVSEVEPEEGLGEIQLEPPPMRPPAAQPKPETKVSPKPTLERPPVQACIDAANASGMKIEELYADATRLAGKTIGSTRDLASLDDTMLGTLAQEIAAFGTEPEATR